MHAENELNQIKEDFLNYQRRTNDSGSSDQITTCSYPFSSSNESFISLQEVCPYFQERAIKLFIL